jgi:hypothetical protein
MTGHDERNDQHDRVGRYLAERGVSAAVQGRGLRGLVAKWDAIATGAERYDLTLDDWLNDLDVRDIIAGAMAVAPEREHQAVRSTLERADDRFRKATVESPRPLAADAEPAQWWYLRYPAQPGAGLRKELGAAGYLQRD